MDIIIELASKDLNLETYFNVLNCLIQKLNLITQANSYLAVMLFP